MSRRRVLLVDPNSADSEWLTQSLTVRFRHLLVTRVRSATEAQHELLNQGYDVIVTDLFGDAERPYSIVHELMSISPATPVIVLTETQLLNAHLLDVVSAGVKHILDKEAVRQDIARLVAAVVEIVHELSRRDSLRDAFGERMHAIARKVNDADNRMLSIERNLEGMVQSINALVQVIERRGGLEDRVHALENNKATAIKVGLWLLGCIGTAAAAIASAVFSWFNKG